MPRRGLVWLGRLALPVEAALDRLARLTRGRRPPVVDPYLGYATADSIVLRGRVLTALRRTNPDPEKGWWHNLRQMVSLFLTAEVEGVELSACGATALSDAEGYVTLIVPRGDTDAGWRSVAVTVAGGEPVILEAQVPRADAPFAVISDIDDTVLETGAYSLWRNLRTSMTGSALSRHVFPDAVRLLNGFAAQGAPVFFVSSSPWNLHHFLSRIFARHEVPRGPMFLRDYGLGTDQFITGTHGDHKGGAIAVIMAANPELSFVLIGDTGQHDPQVYLAAARQFPGRVARVILRQAGAADDPADLAAIEDLRRLGVRVETGPDYTPFLEPDPGT